MDRILLRIQDQFQKRVRLECAKYLKQYYKEQDFNGFFNFYITNNHAAIGCGQTCFMSRFLANSTCLECQVNRVCRLMIRLILG